MEDLDYEGRRIIIGYEGQILKVVPTDEYVQFDEFDEEVENLSPDTPAGIYVQLVSGGGEVLAEHYVA